ncbi:MAG: LysR family transcriptional regulator [Rhodospirillales bacterium]|nr:LysR family transcriptional regulator [Rhodospirillales bacterium]MDE2575774.1 LysR family transcriptional regulator [Rhodospirillales bacterium]
MDYRQLQLFRAVAERQNLSQAAEAVGITQPGLSKSLRGLQQELGVRLYSTRGRGIELTEAGRALLAHAKLVEAQFTEARAELAGIASGVLGHARIGAGPAWISRHLPGAIAVILRHHPKLRFTVETGYAERLIGRLRQGELDVVIGALPQNRTDPDLRFQRLSTDTIGVIGRTDHPLLRVANRSLADYVHCSWALPNRAELLRQRLDGAFRKAGLGEAKVAVESDSLSLMLATLRLTDCLGLATTQTLSQDEAHGIVSVEHAELLFHREAGLISRRHTSYSPPVQLLVTELRRVGARAIAV